MGGGERGPGVLGPLEEAAEVKDDEELRLAVEAEDIELTRGDELFEKYNCGGGRGRDGNLSFIYNGRCAASEL